MGTDFWRAFLSGCVLHGNVELAELVATKVFELDPEESNQAVLLSNVYASVGRFQDAEALRSSMQKKGFLDDILWILAVSFLFREENAEKTARICSFECRTLPYLRAT
ncbi:hypothetical protein Dsin_025472 [Dipteronia sinensis]|uniref:Pentatricopeptide repeat-containing protein n=1 Tax=Dipteronia sinensis TaxID=43782 RepID=A0AAE0DX01_9ROSI|nr:hypothetical protein Dsin_025472 [Dipteronia sinensis]